MLVAVTREYKPDKKGRYWTHEYCAECGGFKRRLRTGTRSVPKKTLRTPDLCRHCNAVLRPVTYKY